MQAQHTIPSHPTAYKGRRRPLIVVAVAFCLLAAAAALFFQLLKEGPEVVNLGGPQARADISVVFVSGDMGAGNWTLGGRVAKRLSESGYPVTVVDSAAAFSQRRTPAQAAEIVARAVTVARARNPNAPIALVGESFGSDMLLMTLRRLPAPLMERVRRIVLIVPSTDAYVQVSPAEVLGLAAPDVDLRQFAVRLPNLPLTCVYGLEEKDSLCPGLAGPQVRRVGLPGGHLLNQDADRVFSLLLEALRPVPMTKR